MLGMRMAPLVEEKDVDGQGPGGCFTWIIVHSLTEWCYSGRNCDNSQIIPPKVCALFCTYIIHERKTKT